MRKAEQLRKQILANMIFPITEYVALAMAYVNIKAPELNEDRLELLVREMRYRFAISPPPIQFGLPGWKSQKDPRSSAIFGNEEAHAHREMPPLVEAAAIENHEFFHNIIKALSGGRRLNKEQHESLEGWVDQHQVTYKLVFEDGVAGYLDLPNADLGWYIALGVSALADRRGQFHKSIKRCANFGGSVKANGAIFCGNYISTVINTGGRMRDTYCSDTCRNRVQSRAAAVRKRADDKKADQEFQENKAKRKSPAMLRSLAPLPPESSNS